jgi:sulfur relay protein TusB/DsrH
MRIAFLITKTPQEEGFNSFIKILNLYEDTHDIYLYLMGNGVYCATHGHVHADLIREMAQKHNVMASNDDLLNRGLAEKHLIKGVEVLLSYEDFVVDIMEEIDQVFSF